MPHDRIRARWPLAGVAAIRAGLRSRLEHVRLPSIFMKPAALTAAMSGFSATPASEELASFLQGLEPGAHVAVALGTLGMDVAVDISRQVAQDRGERFIVVAHQASGSELVADSLTEAIPLEKFVAPRGKAWVVVDAAASVATRSAHDHAAAEARLGVEVAPRLTVVCFYTEDALAQVDPKDVRRLHGVVASPAGVT